ncbi:MAG: hypothetical protein GX987_05245 [Tissierellia bacterium]|jgi:hypothetical protein|nr:hypothetical protein [Tissierellia bacterium]
MSRFLILGCNKIRDRDCMIAYKYDSDEFVIVRSQNMEAITEIKDIDLFSVIKAQTREVYPQIYDMLSLPIMIGVEHQERAIQILENYSKSIVTFIKPYNEDRVSLIKVDNIREIRMEANRYSIVFESKSLLKRYELCDKRVVRYIDSFDVHKRKDCIYNLIRYMNQDNVNTYFILFKNYSKRNPQVLLIHSL